MLPVTGLQKDNVLYRSPESGALCTIMPGRLLLFHRVTSLSPPPLPTLPPCPHLLQLPHG